LAKIQEILLLIESKRDKQLQDHPIFAKQLVETNRYHEVTMMLIAALEKLFQAMEYVQYPVREDLKRR